MLDRTGSKLLVFENFQRDYSLPKFQQKVVVQRQQLPRTKAEAAEEVAKEEEATEEYGDSDHQRLGTILSSPSVQYAINSITSSNSATITMNTGATGNFTVRPTTWGENDLMVKEVRSWREKTAMFFRRIVPKRQPREPVPEITIPQFFASMKNSTEELATVRERAVGYEAALKKAQQTGQTALFEQLKKGVIAHRAETQLLALALPKYLSEETVVRFVKKAAKGVRLDWVMNFTRPVPDDLLTKKLAADERGIFDNYAVMHYDPEAKSWAETEAQVAARKDPILFGLIEGRRRLYYVGDWVDEFCDLTLDQIADKLGADYISQIGKTSFT